MAHDVISGTGCILVWQRRISTLRSQISRDMTKLELFTTFACLTTPVSTPSFKRVPTNLHGTQAVPFASTFVRGFPGS